MLARVFVDLEIASSTILRTSAMEKASWAVVTSLVERVASFKILF